MWCCASVFCFFGSSSSRLSLCAKIFPRPHMLGCTNAAKRPPHSRPTRPDARRGVRRGCPRVGAASAFFFFFFFSSDLGRLGSIRTDAAQFAPNQLRFAPNRADSRRIVKEGILVVLPDWNGNLSRGGQNKSQDATQKLLRLKHSSRHFILQEN